jgi:hypothetical protein
VQAADAEGALLGQVAGGDALAVVANLQRQHAGVQAELDADLGGL